MTEWINVVVWLSFVCGIIVVSGISDPNRTEYVVDISQIYHVSKKNSEFYWRKYSGKIPRDALPGGKDKGGKSTYIGQVKRDLHTIIPGQMDSSQNKLFYYYIAVGYGITENIKILCSKYPEKFEWIKTNVNDMQFLSGYHLVPGGFDDGYPLLIGRANLGGHTVVGKVTIYYKYSGFAYAVSEKEAKRNDEEFEILSYNP